MSIYQFEAVTPSGEKVEFEGFKDKVLLIVNTASKCGFTPQFEGLEKLHQELKDQGLVVMGFPCNQFANQDPASDGEIQEFCQLNYGVSFTMFSKIEVNGDQAHPLFSYLKKEAKGLMGTSSIKWNFTKFLVDAEGNVVKRYAPKDKPSTIKKDILKLLNQ